MTTHGNAVNSVNAKTSAKKGLAFTRDDLEKLHWIDGLSMKDIGRMYDVSGTAIKYWMNKFGLEHRAQMQTVLFEPSPALSYVFGVLHGDGFLYRNPATKHNGIILAVIDQPFAEAFRRALLCLGIRSPMIHLAPRDESHQPQWKVYACSAEFHRLWNALAPEQRLDLGFRFASDFLRGLYDSEGSVKYHRGSLEMTIVSTNLPMLDRAEAALVEKGFTPKRHFRPLPSGKTFSHLSLYRQLEVKRFMAWIVPTIKVVPRGDANTEPSQDGDILEGVETTNVDQTGQQVGR